MSARGPIARPMLGRRRQAPIQVGVTEIEGFVRLYEPPATPTADLTRKDTLRPRTPLALMISSIAAPCGPRRHYARPSDHPTQTPKVFSTLRGNDQRGSRIAIFVAFRAVRHPCRRSSCRDCTLYLAVSASNRPGHDSQRVRVPRCLEAPTGRVVRPVVPLRP
jgi:hypothetical protein